MRRVAHLALVLVVLFHVCSLALSTASVSAAPPPGFLNETLILNLTQPTNIVFTPDGRMLVLEREGKLWVVQPGATQVDPAPMLQLTNINTDMGERGAVGITLDPAFAANGYYYVFYTANSPVRDRLSRFTATGNSTDMASELVIWQDNVDADWWHHGGTVAFGPDGKLYMSTGYHTDSTAGYANASQRLDSYHGKILRINPDGSVPADNPFNDGPGSNLDAIWALGLRNPFRFSFDVPTGRMFIGDVGGNLSTSIEELNLGAAGANYGWPVCEGPCSTAGMTNPIYFYPHNGRDASITGGLVYRGAQFPPEYQGTYFFADYAQNWIRRLTFDVNGAINGNYAFEPEDGSTDGPYGEIVDLKVGPDGALYYVDIALDNFGNQTGPGTVRRVSYFSTNQPPVINSASASPTSGPGPALTVTFSSSATDPEGNLLTFTWDFGDGTTGAGPDVVHTYDHVGAFSARLTVSDGQLQTLSDPVEIIVGSPPVLTLSAPTAGATFRAGDTIDFAGTATDDGGELSPSAYSWTVLFHHGTHIHPAAGPISGMSGSFVVPTTGHDFTGDTWYEFNLTVTDAQGLKSSASVSVYPQKVNMTLATTPPGLTLSFDQLTDLATPLVYDDVIGFEHTLTAPLQQTLNGVTYDFVGWSDGGAASHNIAVPAADQTYLATYVESALPPTSTPTSPPGGGVFPATGVLDNFNRANGGLGSNWSGSTGGYSVAGNQVDVAGGGDAYWAPSPFGADQEAYVTFTTIDPASSEMDLLLKAQSSTTWSGGVLEVWYDAANQRAQVWTYANNQGWVQHGADISAPLVNGDRFGARATSSGQVSVYRNGSLLGTRDITGWPYAAGGGYIGVWMIGAANAVLDDFGGGTLGAPPAPTNTPAATATALPPTSTPTNTPLPPAATNTPTWTPTATATALPPTSTATATATALPPTSTPTSTPTATSTALPPTSTPTSTPTATATALPPTSTPTSTPTATSTALPPTSTPTGTPAPGVVRTGSVADGTITLSVAGKYQLDFTATAGWQPEHWFDLASSPSVDLANKGNSNIGYNVLHAPPNMRYSGSWYELAQAQGASISILEETPARVMLRTEFHLRPPSSDFLVRTDYTVYASGRVAVNQVVQNLSSSSRTLSTVEYAFVNVEDTLGWDVTALSSRHGIAFLRTSGNAPRPNLLTINVSNDSSIGTDGTGNRYWQVSNQTLASNASFVRQYELQLGPGGQNTTALTARVNDVRSPGIVAVSGAAVTGSGYDAATGTYALWATAGSVSFYPTASQQRHQPSFLVTGWNSAGWELRLDGVVIASSAQPQTGDAIVSFDSQGQRLLIDYLGVIPTAATIAQRTFTVNTVP